MAWFKVDDKLWSHPKWLETPPAARGLWITAGSWCAHHEQDGVIPRSAVRFLGHTFKHASDLVRVRLWIETEAGYEFHGWAEFQPTSAELQEKRAIKAAAGRAGGLASGRSRREAGASPGASRPDEANGKPVPVPSRTPSTTTAAPDGFAEFWEVWPRKEDKKKAGAAYAKALKRSDADTILAGAKRYRDDPNRLAQYTKLPTTWLNGDCWDDAPLPPRGDGRPTSQQPAYDPWAAGYAELEKRRKEAG